MRVGPFRTRLAHSVEDVKRYFDCEKYLNCLDKAADKNWRGFSCSGCFYNKNEEYIEDIVVEPETRRIPIRVFLARIDNDHVRYGYTINNFLGKLLEDVIKYYGQESIEYEFVRLKLLFLRSILTGEDYNRTIEMELISRTYDSYFGKVVDLQDIYFKICSL